MRAISFIFSISWMAIAFVYCLAFQFNYIEKGVYWIIFAVGMSIFNYLTYLNKGKQK